jgi:hypothetical protein
MWSISGSIWALSGRTVYTHKVSAVAVSASWHRTNYLANENKTNRYRFANLLNSDVSTLSLKMGPIGCPEKLVRI